jgi:hypothetical protein
MQNSENIMKTAMYKKGTSTKSPAELEAENKKMYKEIFVGGNNNPFNILAEQDFRGNTKTKNSEPLFKMTESTVLKESESGHMIDAYNQKEEEKEQALKLKEKSTTSIMSAIEAKYGGSNSQNMSQQNPNSCAQECRIM